MPIRDTRGRYLGPNPRSGSSGKPKASARQYITALVEEIDALKFRRLLRRLMRQALDGDRHSQALIMKHAIPDPTRLTSLPDDEELRVGGAPNRETVEREMAERLLRLVDVDIRQSEAQAKAAIKAAVARLDARDAQQANQLPRIAPPDDGRAPPDDGRAPPRK